MACSERHQEVLDIELAAGTEAAAGVALDEVYRAVGHAQHLRAGMAVEERHLGRAVHDQPAAGRVPVGDHAARFHRDRRLALHREVLALDVHGRGEGRIGVTALRGEGHAAVGGGAVEKKGFVGRRRLPVGDRG